MPASDMCLQNFGQTRKTLLCVTAVALQNVLALEEQTLYVCIWVSVYRHHQQIKNVLSPEIKKETEYTDP